MNEQELIFIVLAISSISGALSSLVVNFISRKIEIKRRAAELEKNIKETVVILEEIASMSNPVVLQTQNKIMFETDEERRQYDKQLQEAKHANALERLKRKKSGLPN